MDRLDEDEREARLRATQAILDGAYKSAAGRVAEDAGGVYSEREPQGRSAKDRLRAFADEMSGGSSRSSVPGAFVNQMNQARGGGTMSDSEYDSARSMWDSMSAEDRASYMNSMAPARAAANARLSGSEGPAIKGKGVRISPEDRIMRGRQASEDAAYKRAARARVNAGGAPVSDERIGNVMSEMRDRYESRDDMIRDVEDRASLGLIDERERQRLLRELSR